jgi:hypothetical protein
MGAQTSRSSLSSCSDVQASKRSSVGALAGGRRLVAGGESLLERTRNNVRLPLKVQKVKAEKRIGNLWLKWISAAVPAQVGSEGRNNSFFLQ